MAAAGQQLTRAGTKGPDMALAVASAPHTEPLGAALYTGTSGVG